jgi:energy-coupling factor transporter ATP-binding protein EcfA2
MLKLVNVSFAFKENKLLEQLNLEFNPGEVVWLKGPSASGKTTLLNIIATIIPRFIKGNFEGQVSWQGTNLNTLQFPQIATILSFLRQHPQQQLFFPKVEQELAFGPENLQKPPAEILQTMQNIGEELHITNLLQAATAQLSFGQKKMVAWAANLMLDAPILLLDEPAAGISQDNLQLIERKLVKEKEAGKIIIMADHQKVWQNLADRTISMSELR